MFVNVDGVFEIQKWIDENKDKTPKGSYLLADGIASEINESDCIEQELRDNGKYSHEIGIRDGQGRSMFIDLYPEHFQD